VNIKSENNTYTTNVTDEVFFNIHVFKIQALMHYISTTKMLLSQPYACKASTLRVQKTQPTTQQNQAPAKGSETSTKRQLTTLGDTHNSKDSHPDEFLAKIKEAFFSKVFCKILKKQ
jgi:hypothetical protein